MGLNAASGNELTLWKAAQISFLTLPVGYLATLCFTLFYGRGHLYMSYPTLSIMAKVAAIAAALVIQIWWLNNRNTNLVEVTGVIIAVAGTTIAIFHKEITTSLGL